MLDAKVYQIQYDTGIENITEIKSYDDFFELDRNIVKENGNMEYLIRIYQTGRLLETNTNQGYHPPLHHYISALCMRIGDVFGATNEVKLELAEIPAFIYSIIIILAVYAITKELELKDFTTILVTAMVSFNPLLIFMSRLINNDPLVTMCTVLSVLYLIKWYKEPKAKNTICLALAIGLGASSKISIIVMYLPLFITYLMKMYKNVENSKQVKKIIMYGLLFSCIAIPLIVWYPIRNAIKFNQPPFSILIASDEFNVQYTDFKNRWLLNNEIFTNKLEFNASNVWAYVINSSIIFMINVEYLNIILLTSMKILSIILIVFSFIGMFRYLRENYIYMLLFITYITWLLSFIMFNISHPASCTMSARYIGILFIIGMIFIGKLQESANSKLLKFLIDLSVLLYSLGAIGVFAQIFYLL